MRQLTILNNFFSSKSCRFEIQNNQGATQVTVETPDLRENKYTSWGDWGPMYSVELNDNQEIAIRYVDRKSFKSESFKIKPKHLQILSPVSATERRIYPFYINIFDKNKRMTYQIYLDKLGIPSRVEALDVDSGQKQFATTHDLEQMATVS